MYSDTKAIIKASNIDYVEINEDEQYGISFGERLCYSIKDTFLMGYTDVIVVGNDCIDLNQEDLIAANNSVIEGKQSIGLTDDGGVYLFSISRNDFHAESFIDLPWCQPQLGADLSNWLSLNSKLDYLKTKSDIDTTTDLTLWVCASKRLIVSLYIGLLAYCKPIVTIISFRPFIRGIVHLQLRAPPTI